MSKNNLVLKMKCLIKEGFSDFMNFGISVMLAKDYCILADDSKKSLDYKHKVIMRYLRKKFSYLVDKYRDMEEVEVSYSEIRELPVWVFWWQGEENMPELIKACHKSKEACAENHPVILLDKNNLSDYITFPDYIWEQYNEGKIKIQHLSDMLRIKLIKEYGGLWLDGSIYCGQKLPDTFFEYPVYSLKKKGLETTNISNDKWTTFTIGGHKNNLLCQFLDEFFMDYCKTGKPFIDYFMFDCAIAFANESIPAIKKSMENMPEYKGDYRWINHHIYDECSDELISEMEKNDNVLYKVAWHVDFSGIKENSLYHFLLKDK